MAGSLFLTPSELDLPFDARAIRGQPAELLFEIGYGNGWFLEQLAASNPGAEVVGAETSISSAHRAWRRIRRSGLSNVRMFLGDAVFMTRRMLAPESVSRIYVNFPDPWPRRKHRAKRMLSEAFFRVASRRLVPGGCVELTTDHADYFAWARSQAVATGVFDEDVGTPPDVYLGTRYARKWLGQDKPIYHVRFTNTGRSGEAEPPLEIHAMQHALLSGDLASVGEMPHSVFKVGGAYVIVMDHLSSGAAHVFAVHVEEEGLKQDILVEAIPRARGVYVGIRRFGSPMATTGVGEAVRVIVEWLQSQGLEVVERWY